MENQGFESFDFNLDEMAAFISEYQLEDQVGPQAPPVDFLEMAVAASGVEDLFTSSSYPVTPASESVTLYSMTPASPSYSVTSDSSVASPSDSSSSSGLIPVAVTVGVAKEDLPRVLEEDRVVRSSSSGPTRTRRRRRAPPKAKLYDLSPLEDEEAERRRQNAVNAKRHRDLKKAELQTVKEELEALRRENQQLKEQLAAFQSAKPSGDQSTPFGNQGWSFLDDFSI